MGDTDKLRRVETGTSQYDLRKITSLLCKDQKVTREKQLGGLEEGHEETTEVQAWSLQTESMESSNGEHGVFKWRAWSLQTESMESSNGEHGVFKRRAWSLQMESMEEIQHGNKHHQPHQLQRLHLQEQVRVGRRPHREWVRRGVDRQTESESLDKLTGMTKNLLYLEYTMS